MCGRRGWGGAGGASSLARRLGPAPPRPFGGSGRRGGGPDSQSARVCLRFFLQEVGRVCVQLRATAAEFLSVHECVPRCVALGVHTDMWGQHAGKRSACMRAV